MLVVIDTNVLVSALWSKNGAPARLVSLVISGALVPCYDYRIMCEYRDVLRRPRFGFSEGEINALLDWIETCGRSVVADYIDVPFVDEEDRKFYEVAQLCRAVLVTGNIKHFPADPIVITVNDFLDRYGSVDGDK